MGYESIFLGSAIVPIPRVATSQKCVRAGGKHNDLENVGYTSRHHTFFEMLGNFSFGDYFKERAIKLAWEFLTEVLNIPRDRLYVTVYHEDHEAYNIWAEFIPSSDKKIIKIATNDNFWSMGDTGPCGPCSEIFYDHGPQYQGGLPGSPEEGGDRYVEIWNLVFMQFEQFSDGTRKSLPKPSIDTGIGLERLAAVMQGTGDNYAIDVFKEILIDLQRYVECDVNNVSARVVMDHIRSITFLLADGVQPSNEGRGYVLRRIIRRAMRHLYNLGCKKPLLYALVPTVIREMGDHYPELIINQEFIVKMLKAEEERFTITLDKGMILLKEALSDLPIGGMLQGETIFKLYDTYGFPVDLTKDIATLSGYKLDENGFEKCMARQKENSVWVGSGDKKTNQIWYDLQRSGIAGTEFIGYEKTQSTAVIQAIIVNNTFADKLELHHQQKSEIWLVLDKTPFYPESGGQIYDQGTINIGELSLLVKEVHRYQGDIIAHKVLLPDNLLSEIYNVAVDSEVFTCVNTIRRNKVRANHSATHLLQHTLRQVLGTEVKQKGSLVEEDKLRFDFSYEGEINRLKIEQIESIINELIIKNCKVQANIMAYTDAIASGAMALFGEKYGNEVRVISMENSKELCGGIHVNRTGEIGVFKIVECHNIAAGVKRIEAITGLKAVSKWQEEHQILSQIASLLKFSNHSLYEKIEELLLKEKELSREVSNLYSSIVIDKYQEKLISNNGCLIIKIAIPEEYNKKETIDVKKISSLLSNEYKKNAIFFIYCHNSLCIQITEDLKNISANEIMQSLVANHGGKGGGNHRYAQAGQISGKVEEMFSAFQNIIGAYTL